jgi:large subunit ribosomal protein L29
MKINEIRGKDTRELLLDRNDLRKEQFKLRFKATAEEISNTARFKQIRRTIARINTVLVERERAAQQAGTGTDKE